VPPASQGLRSGQQGDASGITSPVSAYPQTSAEVFGSHSDWRVPSTMYHTHSEPGSRQVDIPIHDTTRSWYVEIIPHDGAAFGPAAGLWVKN